MLLPQIVQKPRSAGSEDWYHMSRDSSIATRSAAAPTQVTNAAPWARWHIVQWQWAHHSVGGSTLNCTAPQRQEPCIFFRDVLICFRTHHPDLPDEPALRALR
jgi:hypothetical protein